MAILASNGTVAFFVIPKCACTSMKIALHPYSAVAADPIEGLKIHRVHRTRRFGRVVVPEGAFKCAIVRSPSSRVLSVYRNKVLEIGCLGDKGVKQALAELKLPEKPSFSEYVANFRGYQSASKIIRTHTQPLSHFLGTDPSYFDKLYPIREVGLLEAELQKHLGAQFAIAKENKSALAVNLVPSDAELAKINEMFSEDIEIFGEFF